MVVQLILSQGSRAGSAAPIHPGYYLVGRNKDCQIRPKSRSVSRRHCLLLHNDDGVGALDLKSKGGTRVNGERLQPHVWKVLHDGDELRFGKVGFTVSIHESALVTTGQTVRNGSDPESDEPPRSWENEDVATFLEDEQNASQLLDELGVNEFASIDDLDPEDDDGFELDDFVNETTAAGSDVLDSDIARSAGTGDTLVGDLPAEGADEGSEPEVEVDAAPQKKPPSKTNRKAIDHAAYKKGSKKSIKLPSISLGGGDIETWKLIGAFALAAVILGFFVYQTMSFVAGPDIPVRRDLD